MITIGIPQKDTYGKISAITIHKIGLNKLLPNREAKATDITNKNTDITISNLLHIPVKDERANPVHERTTGDSAFTSRVDASGTISFRSSLLTV